ncbi:MAG: hypothetical protein IJW45_03955 [Oscillospiraceae bacterium]|nr:hypothetical protein [Oscillospiraceae bacterium]
MIWLLVILAAFGALCVLWVLFGFLLTGTKGTVMVCLHPQDAEAVVRQHGWLQDLGLVRCPLIMVDLEEAWARRLDVECCPMAQIVERLERERTGFD